VRTMIVSFNLFQMTERKEQAMTTTMSPFRFSGNLVQDFRRELDDLFSQFFREGDDREPAFWAPRANLSETENEYAVSIDLPGVTPENISIELRHGDLWITGRREEESEEQGKTWHRIERFAGEFRRVIRVGDDVDAEHVNAEYKDGVLHVAIPKSEDAQTKRITVKASR